MRIAGVTAFVVGLAVFVSSQSAPSPTAKRDEALKRINACLKRNEVSRGKCRTRKQDIETLIQVYKDGDKSVLPTLLHFNSSTDFYDETLISDPEGFLTAMSHLPEEQQRTVALGLAGVFKTLSKERFTTIRALLTAIPDSSPLQKVAQISLKELETWNACLFVQYFPPEPSRSKAADVQCDLYSSVMYGLGEKPLWPPANDETIYRFTFFPAFFGPTVASLTVQPDGSGIVTMKTLSYDRQKMTLDTNKKISAEGVQRFLERLDQSHFWFMPTQSPNSNRGLDGAEWMMEAVQDGQYHVITRWCPDLGDQPEDDRHFAKAAWTLFSLAGHEPQ